MGRIQGLRATVTVGALGLVLAGCGQRSAPASTAPYEGVQELPEQLAADGTTIVVGDPRARTTVRVYEDPRCPVVEEYERTGAAALTEMTLARKTKTEYVFASFKDGSLGGDGSKRAVNSLRAALEAGKFAEYHAVLFENQQEAEESGGFTTAMLLELAGEVKGLRGKAFDSAVTTMKYQPFVTASQAAYQEVDGPDPAGPGTPSVMINEKELPDEMLGVVVEPAVFTRLLIDIHHKRGIWRNGVDVL
ncbi:thioredoxin domain-containing protein [Streptomyces albidochromogenes]|uniref:DsbA family protein n=1 Tax=Streptomyces albidochromogenes TaxID=329524 RepID=UPI001FCC19B9|nr:thioredoxin domain-containing protein [Streptomyces albidochromogenes]